MGPLDVYLDQSNRGRLPCTTWRYTWHDLGRSLPFLAWRQPCGAQVVLPSGRGFEPSLTRILRRRSTRKSTKSPQPGCKCCWIDKAGNCLRSLRADTIKNSKIGLRSIPSRRSEAKLPQAICFSATLKPLRFIGMAMTTSLRIVLRIVALLILLVVSAEYVLLDALMIPPLVVAALLIALSTAVGVFPRAVAVVSLVVSILVPAASRRSQQWISTSVRLAISRSASTCTTLAPISGQGRAVHAR